MIPDIKTLDYFRVIHEHCNTIEFLFDKKNSLYIPLFTTSIDHSLSIHILENQRLVVSCLALARPMIESYLRAMWVKYCLPEDKINEGCTIMHFPTNLELLLSEIKGALPENILFSELKSSIEPLLVNMHDYTHTGIQSIARQYDENEYLTNGNCLSEMAEIKKLAVLISSLSYEELIPYMSNGLPYAEISKSATELIKL